MLVNVQIASLWSSGTKWMGKMLTNGLSHGLSHGLSPNAGNTDEQNQYAIGETETRCAPSTCFEPSILEWSV